MGLLNDVYGSTSVLRLSDVLFERSCRTFGSLAAFPSNVEAIEAALLFSAGLHTLVTLVGPSGWGKSHLLDAVVHRLGQEPGTVAEVRSAAEFLHLAVRQEPQTLVLDDVQEVLAKPKQRQMLRLALERRVRAGKPTILSFTLPKVSRQLKTFLPSCREWVVATMDAPQAEERILLLNQMAKAEGLQLSPSLVRIIALQMHGNGRTLAGAMKRLRLAGPTWLDLHSTLKALGLLEPFFADNSSWDLKHRILRTADSYRLQFSRVLPLDLALYTMLHIASLSEADVARVAGVAPAEAYLRANRFCNEARESSETRAYISQFVEIVVASLANE